MTMLERVIAAAANTVGADPQNLRGLATRAALREWSPEEWLFHESTPYRWTGIIEEGAVLLDDRRADRHSHGDGRSGLVAWLSAAAPGWGLRRRRVRVKGCAPCTTTQHRSVWGSSSACACG